MKRNKMRRLISFLVALSFVFTTLGYNMSFAAVDRYNTPLPGWNTNTPVENVFKVQGSTKEFVLLNTTENDSSKYFILAKDAYGPHAYDPDNTQRFDPSDPNNLAYWLNNAFKTSGNGAGNILPSEILAHIDYNHQWLTEGGYINGNCPTDYTTTAGIVVLSQTEWANNITKFGVRDNIKNAPWWLRTGRGINGNANVILCSQVSDTLLGQTHINNANVTTVNVRPAFYLDKSFFSSVKLDLASLGSNVKAAILNTYTWDDLSGIYSNSELVSMGYEPPVEADTTAPSWTTSSAIVASNTTDGSFDVMWTPATDENGVGGYKVFVNGGEASVTYNSDEDSVYGSVYKTTISGLEPYTLYNVKVEALDMTGNISQDGPATTVRTLPPAGMLVPTDDAHTNAGTKAEVNYGSSTDMDVKTDVTELTRQAFLKFDLNSISTEIGSAQLQIYSFFADSIGTEINNSIYGVEEDSWSEGSVVWNNRPAADSYLGKVNVNKTWGWKTIDVTSYINQQYAKDKTASFAIIQEEAPGRNTKTKSKEDPIYYPRLIISENRVNADAPAWPADSSITVSRIGESDADISWTAAQDSGTVSYNVIQDGVVVATVTDTEYSLQNLAVGEKYTIRIQAVDEDGNIANDGPITTLETGKTYIEQVKLGNIFLESESVQFKIYTKRSSVSWFAYDVWGKLAYQGSQPVTGGSTVITVPADKKGYFDLNVYVQEPNKQDIKIQTTFSVFSDYDFTSVEDSPFGISTHFAWTFDGWGPQLVDLVNRVGAKNFRDGPSWETIEKEKGVYTSTTDVDNYMAEAKKYNLNPFFVLCYTNPFYDSNSTPYTDDGRLGFANYGVGLLQKYPDQVKWVEVYNEFNIGFGDRGTGPADSKATYYYDLLKKSYEVIKSSSPGTTIVGNSTAGIPEAWINELLSYGAIDYMDKISIHPYRYPKTPEGLADELVKLTGMVKANNNGQSKPIVISEMGWPTHSTASGVDEKTQSDYVARSYVVALANGVEKMFWYDLMNDGTDKTYNEDNFGLIRYADDAKGKYTPKPAYAAYGAMTRQLTNAQFVEKEDKGTNIQSYKFTRNSSDIRVLWTINTAETVSLKTDTALQITDYMGNTSTYSPINGAVNLTLTGEPVYVEGNLQDITSGADLSMTASNAIIGEEITLTLGVNNTSDTPVSAIFDIGGTEYTVEAPAGQNGQKNITLPAIQQLGKYSFIADVSVNGSPAGKLKTEVTVTESYKYTVTPHITNADTKEAAVKVEVSNISSLNPLSLTQINWSVTTQSGIISVANGVAPNSKGVFEIPLGVVEYWKSYPTTITAQINGKSITLYTGNIDFSPVTKKTILPEDEIDVTQSGIDITTGTIKITSGYTGVDDLSGNAWINWDDNNFYLTARIKDDVFVSNMQNGDIWQNDSIQFSVASGIPGVSSQWYEYGISKTPAGNQIYRWLAPDGMAVGRVNNGQLSITRDEENKYTIYKLALPWSELTPIVPENYPIASISIALNENDSGAREGYIEWGSGIGGTKDPGKFRSIEFLPGNTDRTALQTAIQTAQGMYDAAEEGTTAGKYPAGSKTVLLSAINAAKAVMENLYTSQEEVDAAVVVLNKAVVDFEKLKIVPHDDSSGNNGSTDNGLELTNSTLPDGRNAELVKVNAQNLKALIETAGNGGKVIVIDLPKSKADVINVELPVSAIKEMDQTGMLSISSNNMSYTIPVNALNLEVGAASTLTISLEKLSKDQEKAMKDLAKEAGLKPTGNSVQYSVTAQVNSQEIEISDYGTVFATRNLVLDSTSITANTTVVWYNPETKEFEFVPVTAKEKDGKTELTINSTQNGVFMVVDVDKTFSDIDSHWAKENIEQLASKLLVNGFTDQTFKPENNITRAEFTALLTKALTLSSPASGRTYSDISSTDWYADAVGAASSAGLISGYADGTFKPEQYITREEAAVLMLKAIAIAGKNTDHRYDSALDDFQDSGDISDWAKDALALLVEEGIISGVSNTKLSPDTNTTRAQAAVILARVLKYIDFIN